MNGYEKLKEAVIRDCNDRNSCGCFHENGCNIPGQRIGNYGEEGYKSCFHSYCDKFKWIIERAKHYEEKLGIPWNEILDSWEENRSYWYMNYYQESNQPLIEGEKVRVFDTLDDYKKSAVHNEYLCPSCGDVSDNAYKCKKCGWKVYGLFGDMGKGVFVYIKELKKGQTIFMPLAWNDENGGNE